MDFWLKVFGPLEPKVALKDDWNVTWHARCACVLLGNTVDSEIWPSTGRMYKISGSNIGESTHQLAINRSLTDVFFVQLIVERSIWGRFPIWLIVNYFFNSSGLETTTYSCKWVGLSLQFLYDWKSFCIDLSTKSERFLKAGSKRRHVHSSWVDDWRMYIPCLYYTQPSHRWLLCN